MVVIFKGIRHKGHTRLVLSHLRIHCSWNACWHGIVQLSEFIFNSSKHIQHSSVPSVTVRFFKNVFSMVSSDWFVLRNGLDSSKTSSIPAGSTIIIFTHKGMIRCWDSEGIEEAMLLSSNNSWTVETILFWYFSNRFNGET